jgi:hypothetical protein
MMSSDAFTDEIGEEKDWFLVYTAKIEDALDAAAAAVAELSELPGEERSIMVEIDSEVR